MQNRPSSPTAPAHAGGHCPAYARLWLHLLQYAIGEHLGHPEQERITTLKKAVEQQFDYPNCVILQEEKANGYGERSTLPPHPIPDHLFELLDGREKMITKAPIRWLTLAALELQNRQSMWDIGFCTGSVSIEAKLLFPHLHINAFEIRPEREDGSCT